MAIRTCVSDTLYRYDNGATAVWTLQPPPGTFTVTAANLGLGAIGFALWWMS